MQQAQTQLFSSSSQDILRMCLKGARELNKPPPIKHKNVTMHVPNSCVPGTPTWYIRCNTPKFLMCAEKITPHLGIQFLDMKLFL